MGFKCINTCFKSLELRLHESKYVKILSSTLSSTYKTNKVEQMQRRLSIQIHTHIYIYNMLALKNGNGNMLHDFLVGNHKNVLKRI